MKILILEDDDIQRDWLRKKIEERFGFRAEERHTEMEFRQYLDEVVNGITSCPDIFIIDLIVRWTNPAPDMTPEPDDVKRQGPARGGLRCARRIRELQYSVPIILYSVLERENIEEELKSIRDVIYIQKEHDPDPILRRIERAIMR